LVGSRVLHGTTTCSRLTKWEDCLQPRIAQP
jgi:hypothetical protein